MLFIQQNVTINKKTFKFTGYDELLDSVYTHFNLKLFNLTTEINKTFYPPDYNYEIYVTYTLNKKKIVLGRLLSDSKTKLEKLIETYDNTNSN